MSIDKTEALVLSVMPYRESSSIATLLSRRFGRVSAIAKGLRRSRHAPLTLERGQLVELVLYQKPHRDLHTIGQLSVVNYFPSIRASLSKLALRDASFELILKSVPVSETHGELFDFAVAFLSRLETIHGTPLPVQELWKFFHGWARHLGFMLNLRECVRCGHGRVATEGGMLAAGQGGLICSACSGGTSDAPLFLPGTATTLLLADDAPAAADVALDPRQQLRILRLLADYCRCHLDIRSDLKTIDFLETTLFD